MNTNPILLKNVEYKLFVLEYKLKNDIIPINVPKNPIL